MDRIGKYEVLDKIGSGGFAVVYKGYDPFIKRAVAIKVCFSRDEETRQRFFREAEVAGRLVHRNVTTVYDFGLHEQMPYLVEEYLPGEDLAHLIERREPETLAEKLDFLVQIAAGLDHAHGQGVIHRDVKPSNVRVLGNGHLKIMDFGTAKLADVDSQLTQTGMTLGTVAYLPPERLVGRPGGPNSDLFSFGVLAYELLSFRRPFVGRNIPSLIDQVLNTEPLPLDQAWPECPAELAAIVHRCLAKDPEERYASSREVLNALETLRTQITQPALALGDETSGSFAAPAELQLTGLLGRAHLAIERGRHDRARVFLDEVLEIAPDHAEAKELLAECERHDASGTTPLPTVETDDERRRRKIGEATASIESYLDRGQMVHAADALRFARRLLGDFPAARALRDRMATDLRRHVHQARNDGRRVASSLCEALAGAHGRPELDLALATPVVALAEELDPENREGRAVLAALHRTTPATASPGDRRARQEADAVASIERWIDAGDPETAEQALRFAREMLGDFAAAPQLAARIAAARREAP